MPSPLRRFLIGYGHNMTKTRWIILMVLAPIIIPFGLFGFCGSEGRSAAFAIFKFYLVVIGIVLVVVAVTAAFPPS